MSEELLLEGKQYVSSKRAADLSEYAQDYIGQLARKGLIDAQRVGGLWYVHMESLLGYKKNADEYKPQAPQYTAQAKDPESFVTFDGKDYVSASRAAKITGYNQDYVGQLARKGAVLSRQVGNRWYVDREGLQAHKRQKDALLASVQSESVGLVMPISSRQTMPRELLHYQSEQQELLPTLTGKKVDGDALEPVVPDSVVSESSEPDPVKEEVREQFNIVPIRVRHTLPKQMPHNSTTLIMPRQAKKSGMKISDIAISRAIKTVTAVTFVVVLSYGFVTFKDQSIYAVVGMDQSTSSPRSFTALAAGAMDRVSVALESLLTTELIYTRKVQ